VFVEIVDRPRRGSERCKAQPRGLLAQLDEMTIVADFFIWLELPCAANKKIDKKG
jgi:hypothetical protein